MEEGQGKPVAGPGPASASGRLVATGIHGLDGVLHGGLPRGRIYVVQGDSGAGKTTFGLQFLLEGVRQGERTLYLGLPEGEDELVDIARSHCWTLEGIHIEEYAITEQLKPESRQTIFPPADIELGECMMSMIDAVERTKPDRVVLDSISELRLLAGDALRYRRQMLSLRHRFVAQGITVLLLEDQPATPDLRLENLAHGVIGLEVDARDFGNDRRRLRVKKIRGSHYREGFHDYRIETGGLRVFPHLARGEQAPGEAVSTVSTGLAELDRLLGGGLDRGASILLVGPGGTGKSSLAAQFVCAAAERNERAALYVFDEALPSLRARTESLGIPLARHMTSGQVQARAVTPGELSPGEFASLVRDSIKDDAARMVVIDSFTGYLNAMVHELFALAQLHELISYLRARGVIVVVAVEEHGGALAESPTVAHVTYLADTVLRLYYYEHADTVRRAIGVFRRRAGTHERTIHDLRLGQPTGLHVGPSLEGFRGVLAGLPTYQGSQPPDATG